MTGRSIDLELLTWGCHSACPGHIRRLMKSADGLWVDGVDWRSLAQAEAAAAAIMERPSAARITALVDESTVQMLHPLPVRACGPAA